MNKTIQFSAKTQYVAPSCKSVNVHTRGIVCQSPGVFDSGRASDHWNEGSDGYNDYDDELL